MKQVFKLLNYKQIALFHFVIFILLLGCDSTKNKIQNKMDLVKYFNSKGRFERFNNSDLIFGDTLNLELKKLLKFDTISEEKLKIKYYRKAAYFFENKRDTIIYFMYGTSVSQSIISQLRIRSFKNDNLVGDYLIFDFKNKNNLKFDYWIDPSSNLTFCSSMKNGKKHCFNFLLENGIIIDNTFIPDSIYRRLDYIPTIGQKVRIYDDFNSKKVNINGNTIALKGKIIKTYGGGKSCNKYMIIQLDRTGVIVEPFIVTDLVINNESSLFKLNNDSLIIRDDLCFEQVYWPIEKPILIKNRVYLEYD